MCKVSYQPCLNHRRICSALCYANFYSENNDYCNINSQWLQLAPPLPPWRLLLLTFFPSSPSVSIVHTGFAYCNSMILYLIQCQKCSSASTFLFSPQMQYCTHNPCTACYLLLHPKQHQNTCYLSTLDSPPKTYKETGGYTLRVSTLKRSHCGN